MRKRGSCHGISKNEIAEFAFNHTIQEVADHFGIAYTVIIGYMWRNKIPYISTNRRSKKERATVYEMINTLSQFYSLASIGEVFGYSRERVRQIVNREERLNEQR